MTSQTWLTYNDVSRSVWWHYLVVIVPDKVQFTDTVTIWVTGGSNTDGYPNIQSEDIQVSAALALTDHVCILSLSSLRLDTEALFFQ
jgi:PhoPQ-activated pathogenicity-related protein